VDYVMPNGWAQQTCPGDENGRVYLVPADAKLNCADNPAAPVSLLIDPRNTKDCQHLTAPNGVRSHTCKSLTINGHRAVTATTEYPKSNLYPADQTVTDYYVDTGHGVVQIDYTYGVAGTGPYQTVFNQLVVNLRVR
jgi:hypothetical protein